MTARQVNSDRMSMIRPEPVAYLVAERRPWTGNPGWIIGDDWSRECATLAEAEEVAELWRSHGQSLPEDIAVLALIPVSGGDVQ